MLAKAREILHTTFGFDQFRSLQAEVISNVLNKKDSVVIMPTGGGKSLCYQIPALIFEGLTLVVSPLISLMQDQVDQLVQYDVAACFLNSSLSLAQYNETIESVRAGRVNLVYMAPETLLKPQVIDLLKSVKLSCMAIDEAHCISEWGHDFRPEYRQLAGLRETFTDAVFLALTATATPRVRKDIISSMAFNDASQFIGSFNRTNLFLQVKAKEQPVQQVFEVLEKFPDQSGIVYCATRRQVDELAGVLADQGVAVAPYHAGLSDDERKRNQQDFVRDDIQVVVATIAFGMGIDKPNVRFVIHFDLPKNIEGYCQEIGRAGRDGLDAHCLLLFSYGDIHKIKYFIDQKADKEKRLAKIHLDAMVAYAESTVCRRQPLLNYFGEEYVVPKDENGCAMCDNCTGDGQDLVDVTVPAQKFLSCVKRTGELFGALHIIDVLLGSKNKKVLQHQHDQLSTYGIGSELSKRQWSHLARQCLQHGLLVMDDNYGSLKLAPKAWLVLRGQESFYGVIIKDDKNAQKVKRSKNTLAIDYDENLFALLRTMRKELADDANVPPYAVFPDRTLIEMSATFPQTTRKLSAVHGIGKVKLEKYGPIFLEEIKRYCLENNIAVTQEEENDFPVLQQEKEKSSSGRIPRYIEVGELFNQGCSITQCMEKYRVKQTTIVEHLSNYAFDGLALREEGLREALRISTENQQQVMKLFAELGSERLAPVKEAFQGEIDYDTLKLMRLLFIIENSGS